MSLDYQKYLNSSKWGKKRQELFDSRGEACEQCGFEYYLHVHHLNYENFGDEKLEDLQILCHRCHLSKHDVYFDKFIKCEPEVKLKKKSNRKTKRQKEQEKLLNVDFNSLTIGQKRKRLKLKGWKNI